MREKIIKKIISCIILAISLITTTTSAFTNFMGSTLNVGIVDARNNYYMSYCYMYDGNYKHWAQAKLGSSFGPKKYANKGSTACSNSPSLYKTTNWTYSYGYN